MILDALNQRLRAALARPAPSGPDQAALRRHAEALTAEGAWADVDYRAAADRAAWPAAAHLERVLALARARALCPGEFDDAFARALDYWLAHDFSTPDPWHHQIGVPRLVGSAALLGKDALSSGARGKVAEVLARARWSRWHDGAWSAWRGTHLAAVAFNVLLRGCFEGVPAWCQEAFERVFAEIRVAPAGEDGIQADLSFFQADARSAADRHGLAFGENCARFLVLGHGTTWQAPAGCLNLFASHLLDGPQWMIRRRCFDGGWPDDGGAWSPGKLDGFAAAVEELAALGITPRQSEMAAFARRLRTASAPALSGHRHFWRLGLAVHQRPAFYASVRIGAEPGRPVDGLTCLLRHGDEYGGGAAWDGRRLPGTTTLQTAAPPADDLPAVGRSGGVTDGEYGGAVVELRDGGVTGRKAWFHFDESVVCLGSGIGCDDASAPVFTSINQCLARGPAVAHGKGGETHVLAPGKSYDLSAAYRLEHDGIMYQFPDPMAVRARIAPQGGPASAAAASPEVFSLWIDHGTQPRHESYVYTVLPAADPDSRRAGEHELSQIKILANTPALQAVWHEELHLVGIVFWEPGILALPGAGRVAVNRPCILLGQDRRPQGMRLSVANPAHEAATIHVEYANRCLCFNLPAGPRGGQSVTRVL